MELIQTKEMASVPNHKLSTTKICL